MLTTKKRTQIFVIFLLSLLMIGGWTGCAPAGARALLKGERLIKEGKYAEAVKSFEEVTAALPDNAKAWNHLGLGYQYAGDPKKAAQAYQTALKLDRNFAEARYNLGSLYLDQNNLAAAITDLTTYTQFNPKNPDGWLKLGLAQKRLGMASAGAEKIRQLDFAKKNLEAAQKIQPSAEALNAIGVIQIQRGHARDAIPYFTTALQLQPNFSDALLNLAVVYHQYVNDRRLALLNYRQFLAVAKQAPEAAQVQLIVRQLESELNPPAARPPVTPTPVPVVSKPATAVASNVPAVVASVPPPKTETNLPKPAVVAKPPVAVVASPKAQTQLAPQHVPQVQPLPPPVALPKKEVPVEVTRLPDPVPIKSAQEIQGLNIVKPVIAISSNNTAAAAPANSVRQTTAPQKNPSVVARLNPVTWFKRKPKAITPMTESPVKTASKNVAEISDPLPRTEVQTQPDPPEAAPSKPVVLRYKYRSPGRPAEGKRADAEPLFARGLQSQRDRRLSDALEAYRQAIKADPTYFEASYNLAVVSRDSGDLGAALVAYEHALAVMPESLNARFNFAFTLQESGYFQDAANELQTCLAKNPNETRAHLLLGNLYSQRLSQVAKAREHYQKVLDAEPRHPQATQIRYWLAAHGP